MLPFLSLIIYPLLVKKYHNLICALLFLRFVTFASEADARVALQAIKNKRFNGNAIKARLKTETLNKSYFR